MVEEEKRKPRKRRRRKSLSRLLDEVDYRLAQYELAQVEEALRRAEKRRPDYIA
ncbi:MAG: hypothetical protein ACTSXC_07605 [Candidatus Freyarchaeota archaeon]